MVRAGRWGWPGRRGWLLLEVRQWLRLASAVAWHGSGPASSRAVLQSRPMQLPGWASHAATQRPCAEGIGCCAWVLAELQQPCSECTARVHPLTCHHWAQVLLVL